MAARTFRDQVALVTGAASGIGRALVLELARRGAHLVLADVDLSGLRETQELLRSWGGVEASITELDVRDEAGVRAWVTGAHQRHGRIDLLFNNAGIGGVWGPTERYSPGDWDRVIDVNLKGVVHGVHAAYPLMVRQGSGHIINTASAAGLLPFPLFGPYCATKHAVVGLSKSLRYEGERQGVRVSVLCPGVVDTPILTSTGPRGVADPAPERILAWWRVFNPIDPATCARQAMDGVSRNKPVIVVPRRVALRAWFLRAFPRAEASRYRRLMEFTFGSFPELSQADAKGDQRASEIGSPEGSDRDS